MKLEEVLSQENIGKKYMCNLNGAIVRNNLRTLEFLNRHMATKEEFWCTPYVNYVWLESEYEEIK